MFEGLKQWFTRTFGDHSNDLLLAASVMRSFPKNHRFDSRMIGHARIVSGMVESFDACTWLAFSRKFKHLGLRVEIGTRVVVPLCGRWGQLEAVRRAFGLTREEFTTIFDPASYGSELVLPDHIAHQLQALGLSRKK